MLSIINSIETYLKKGGKVENAMIDGKIDQVAALSIIQK